MVDLSQNIDLPQNWNLHEIILTLQDLRKGCGQFKFRFISVFCNKYCIFIFKEDISIKIILSKNC